MLRILSSCRKTDFRSFIDAYRHFLAIPPVAIHQFLTPTLFALHSQLPYLPCTMLYHHIVMDLFQTLPKDYHLTYQIPIHLLLASHTLCYLYRRHGTLVLQRLISSQ